MERFPYAFARKQGAVLAAAPAEKGLIVYFRNDVTLGAIAEVQRVLGCEIQLQSVDESQFGKILREVYEQGSKNTIDSMSSLEGNLDLFAVAEEFAQPEDLLDADDDAPIIRLINALLTEAIKQNASDIHLEPYENRLSVRFRIDGVLREILEPNRSLAPLLTSRVKVMAKLDIAEKRLPQDGRISLRIGGRPVDVRVSTMPTGFGERIVMRILDKQAGRLTLEHLGFSKAAKQLVESIIRRPHGIILITGPTGSGKSTSLYSILMRLNDHVRNIMTIEDPIEYNLDGVSQTNVNAKVDMSFARGLRAILRQDPDVVMVGEIRDLETAQISVQASLTGHLVLSTLHTNSAIGAVTRLRDMGIEPFLLSTSLIGVISQRLVRTLCDCKHSYQGLASDYEMLSCSNEERPLLHKPAGCEHCNHTGYRGRSGIYEVVTIDDAMRQLIHDEAGEQAMEAQLRQVSSSLFTDGARQVLNGGTSLEELLRVVRDE
jgi:general secretion pathway protein E